MVGNASYVLLIASMAMRDMFWLRVLAIFSGIAGIAYDVIWLSDPVGTFWESAFTITNLVQWFFLIREDRKLRLTLAEEVLYQEIFSSLSRKECKMLLMHSARLDLKKGDMFIEKGQIMRSLYIVLSGKVAVVIDDQQVSTCTKGDLLGEMSFLSGKPATASTIMASHGQLLKIGHNHLANLIEQSGDLGNAVNALISKDLVRKLDRSNDLLASA